jgi:hypothetical protein
VIGILLTHTLGHALRDPYPGAFLAGVADAIGDADTGQLLPLPPGDTDCRAVRNAAVDGFIVSSLPDGHPALEVVRGRGVDADAYERIDLHEGVMQGTSRLSADARDP